MLKVQGKPVLRAQIMMDLLTVMIQTVSKGSNVSI
jgi:hypothetical protein